MKVNFNGTAERGPSEYIELSIRPMEKAMEGSDSIYFKD
jgi:hypothetical protein